jgi:hypothetical protein
VFDAVNKLRQILRALKPIKSEGYEVTTARKLHSMSKEEKQSAVDAGRYTDQDFIDANAVLEKIETRKVTRGGRAKTIQRLGGCQCLYRPQGTMGR